MDVDPQQVRGLVVPKTSSLESLSDMICRLLKGYRDLPASSELGFRDRSLDETRTADLESVRPRITIATGQRSIIDNHSSNSHPP